eukprot:TRINITY_DN2031_c0_g1_i4.p1 TRINITY_DN2031_c0_g1~~TRINITY_DN2031_c0_g1_i4.p1  ORF type:complete len:461 (+),score=100.96 TRINITY_DN2031_c0_g1_i4:428-1810(+)
MPGIVNIVSKDILHKRIKDYREKVLNMLNARTREGEGLVDKTNDESYLPQSFGSSSSASATKSQTNQEIVEEMFWFWPKGFNLNVESDYQEFLKIYQDYEKSENTDPLLYIIKVPRKHGGSGVSLLSSSKEIEDLKLENSSVYPLSKTKPLAQRYISRPLLLSGHKTTLRGWILITSMDPLRLYIFPNGLLKFASRRYNLEPENFQDIFTHIASYELNSPNMKEYEDSVKDSDITITGMRTNWNILFKYLEEKRGASEKKLRERIYELVLMSILSVQENMYHDYVNVAIKDRPRRLAPFEMVGYDILIDEDMNPHLLEINNSPSLTPHTELENEMKITMLKDLFKTVDVDNNQYDEVQFTTDKLWETIQNFKNNNPTSIFKTEDDRSFDMNKIKSKEDVYVIVESVMEFKRSDPTKFVRIFPPSSPDHFSSKYLELLGNNPHNQLVVDWLNSGLQFEDIK